MQNRTNILIIWVLINIIISFVIGWLSSSILPSQKESIIAGVIALIITSNLQFIYELYSLNGVVFNSFSKTNKKINVSFEFLQIQSYPKLYAAIKSICVSSLQGLMLGYEKIDESNIYRLFTDEIFRHLEECDNNLSQLRSGVVRIEREKSNVFWTKILRNAKKSYRTTNLLTSSSNSFGQSSEDATLNLQRETLERLGQDNFTRIFIYESEEILLKFQKTVELQKNIGIDVKTISLDRYNELGQEQWSSKIGCSDFAIIDDEFVYITVVDDTTKKSTYVELTNNRIRLSSANTLYQLLMSHAK